MVPLRNQSGDGRAVAAETSASAFAAGENKTSTTASRSQPLVKRWRFISIYTLQHLPVAPAQKMRPADNKWPEPSVQSNQFAGVCRSEEHTSELQSLRHLVCRLL